MCTLEDVCISIVLMQQTVEEETEFKLCVWIFSMWKDGCSVSVSVCPSVLQDSQLGRGDVVPADDSGQETETRCFLNRRGTSSAELPGRNQPIRFPPGRWTRGAEPAAHRERPAFRRHSGTLWYWSSDEGHLHSSSSWAVDLTQTPRPSVTWLDFNTKNKSYCLIWNHSKYDNIYAHKYKLIWGQRWPRRLQLNLDGFSCRVSCWEAGGRCWLLYFNPSPLCSFFSFNIYTLIADSEWDFLVVVSLSQNLWCNRCEIMIRTERRVQICVSLSS